MIDVNKMTPLQLYEANLCFKCRKPLPDHYRSVFVTCPTCQGRAAVTANLGSEEKPPVEKRCPVCGEILPPNSRRKRCDKCWQKVREENAMSLRLKNAARYAERIAERRCVSCGKPLTEDVETRTCPDCLYKIKLSKFKRGA